METELVHSIRRWFILDSKRSRVEREIFFYEYLGSYPYQQELGDKKISSDKIFLIIEPNFLTFKREISYKDLNQNKTANDDENLYDDIEKAQLHDLLVIPLGRKYSDFLSVENQMIRLKKRDKSYKKYSQWKKEGATFEDLLHHFIEDLYVNKYFKEFGSTQSLKASLEHIPLLQGIINRHLFNFYFEECKDLKKKDIRTLNRLEHFEDVYLNYSKFLSVSDNEVLYRQGGWFVDVDNIESENIDDELQRIEENYILIDDLYEDKEFLFAHPVNIKQILKRYGIVDILRITLPSFWVNVFIYSLISLILFILAEIILFNITNTYVASGNYPPQYMLWMTITEQGMKYSSIVFFICTVYCGITLFLKYGFRVVPALFLPRMNIAILSGWLIFLTAEEMFKVDMDIGWKLLLFSFAFIFILTVFFMMFEVSGFAISMMKRKVLKRSLIVTSLAFVASYTIGFWAMSFINNKFMSVDYFTASGSSFVEYMNNRKIDYTNYLIEINSKLRELEEKESKLKEAEFNNIIISFDSEKNRLLLRNINPIGYIKKMSESTFVFDSKEMSPIKTIDDEIKEAIVKVNNRIHDFNKLLDKVENVEIINNQITNNVLGLEMEGNYYLKLEKDIIPKVKQPVENVKVIIPDLELEMKIQKTSSPIRSKKEINISKVHIPKSLSINTYSLLQASSKIDPQDYISSITKEDRGYFDVKGRKAYYKKYKISFFKEFKTDTIFVNMLAFRALLAMFVGIFLNLIMQDKTITEPI